MLWLKQSTAATVKIGPFIDNTDFITPLTALTISQADIRLSKNGGAFAQTNNAAGATHDASGWYGVPLDTTDTNTLGRLQLFVAESGALQVWGEFMVLPAGVFDTLITNSGGALVAGITGNITGNLSGSVGSVTGAVGSVTGAVGSVTGAVGSVTGAVASVTGAVGSVTGLTASDVGAIKAKTDSLTFTLAAKVDANTLAVNGDTAVPALMEASFEALATVTVGVGSTPSSVVATTSPAISVANQFAGRLMYFRTGTTTAALRGSFAVINSHTAGGTFTLDRSLPGTPVSGDLAVIL